MDDLPGAHCGQGGTAVRGGITAVVGVGEAFGRGMLDWPLWLRVWRTRRVRARRLSPYARDSRAYPHAHPERLPCNLANDGRAVCRLADSSRGVPRSPCHECGGKAVRSRFVAGASHELAPPPKEYWMSSIGRLKGHQLAVCRACNRSGGVQPWPPRAAGVIFVGCGRARRQRGRGRRTDAELTVTTLQLELRGHREAVPAGLQAEPGTARPAPAVRRRRPGRARWRMAVKRWRRVTSRPDRRRRVDRHADPPGRVTGITLAAPASSPQRMRPPAWRTRWRRQPRRT